MNDDEIQTLLAAATTATQRLADSFEGGDTDELMEAAWGAAEAVRELTEQTRNEGFSDQQTNLLAATSHALEAANDEDGTHGMAKVVVLLLAELTDTLGV